MAFNPIPIEKKEFIQVLEAEGFGVEVSNLELNKSATLIVYFFDKDGNMIKTDCCILSQPDYDEWTTDAWLISYVANRYGLVLKN